MMNVMRKILFALCLLLGLSTLYAQDYTPGVAVNMIHYLDSQGLDGEIQTCDYYNDVWPHGEGVSTADFVFYCSTNQNTIPDEDVFVWNDVLAFWSEQHDTQYTLANVHVWGVEDHEDGMSTFGLMKKYTKTFHVEIVNPYEPINYTFIQYFFVAIFDVQYAMNHTVPTGRFVTDFNLEREGALPVDAKMKTTIEEFLEAPIDGFNPQEVLQTIACPDDAELLIRYDEPEFTDEYYDEYGPCYVVLKVTYHIYDNQVAGYYGFYGHQAEVATIDEYQVLKRAIHYNATIGSESFETDTPPAPTKDQKTIKYLEKMGAYFNSRCPKKEWIVTCDPSEDEEVIEGFCFMRTYHVYPEDCEEEEHGAKISQRWIKQIKNPPIFELSYENAPSEDEDGWAKVTFPEFDIGCHTIIANDIIEKLKNSYTLIFHNNETDEDVEGEMDEENDLPPGDWTAEVYPKCPDCGFDENTRVYTEDFKIKVMETKMIITYGARYFSDYSYISAFGLHKYREYDVDNLDEVPDSITLDYGGNAQLFTMQMLGILPGSGLTIDILSQKSDYRWTVEKGHEIYDDYPGEIFSIWAQEYEALYGEHFVVAKSDKKWDSPRRFTFSRYKKGTDELLDQVRKPLITEKVCTSDDPNEIFGPAGYTDPDSTVVRMISPQDNLSYTIQFENNPEFATAAAARVKIECPLDEHGDPTTFRLGNFGFGSQTFEVPPMSDYYNRRIDMDSLWLDVTAGILVPDNIAYWIFQSIDPATGVAPIDTLGFLPVNDTLTGVGEGFVTFTMASKATSQGTQINTGETIEERADIYFDENEVVPTNLYVNTFDAVAPTSTIVGDTTGAQATSSLRIGFNASDDENGSGISYVELYVSIDLAGFELVGQVDPDSIYTYNMMRGSVFEFMGLAIDNVGNKEDYKPNGEFIYSRGTPPYDMRLSNNVFEENAQVGTTVGNFSTFDDQEADSFVYALVSGEGDDDNSLFTLDGKALKTNFDFRCHGVYEFTIRVRTTDLTNASLEKSFTLYANETEGVETTTTYEYLCPGDSYYFAGQWITEEGVYFDTLTTQLGCDSVLRKIVRFNPTPVTTEVSDDLCYGSDYFDNGFELTVDTLNLMTQDWNMEEDYTLLLDRYVLNSSGCYDTTRLSLTLHPAFAEVEVATVCSTDLPYIYRDNRFFNDTVAVFSYPSTTDCDSTYTLQLTVKQEGVQSNDLTLGWNWYSTYIDQSNGEGLTNLENALNGNGQMIKSKTAFVTYDPNYNMWFGSLEEINNTSMFMVKMRDPQVTSLSGCPADIDTIMLASGWTWIGYPLTDTTGINQLTPAIGGAPANNDIIKSKQSFAMYNAEYGIWVGSLDNMTPGIGYMYLSKANNVKPLYYGNRLRENDVQPLEIPVVHWSADDKPFANNMTIMGIISLDGQIINSDTLEVGAFVNNEQRGSGRAVYIEQMDAYRIFLTVHGEDGETVSFHLFDHSRDKERRIRGDKQLAFQADRHYGTLDEPYVFSFETYFDKYIQAEICQGEYYTDNNFRVFEPGTYFKELTTIQGNDSVVRLDLTVNPVYHVEEEVVAVEFPYEYEGVVFDKPGTFVLPFKTAAACDSVWEVTVTPYEGLRELLISPQPALKTQRVSLYYPFTQAEQRGVVVEIFTVGGSLLQSMKPTRFPIELDPFPTAGTYMVKITLGTGEVLSGKIIIR